MEKTESNFAAAVQAAQMVVDALTALKAQLEQSSPEEQTELQTRIASLEWELEVKRDAVVRVTPTDPEAYRKLAEAEAARLNAEQASHTK